MILVFVETDPKGTAQGASEVSLETVTFARTLAERTGGPVHAVVVGDRPDGLVDQLGGYGVTEVHHATGDAVAAYGGAAWAAAVQTAVAAVDADVVLAPGTPRGMEVAAHLAARLDVPMAANVVGIERDRRGRAPLRVTRQVVGGAVLEEMVLPERPAVLTVAGHAVEDEPGVPGAATLREFTPEVAEADLVARRGVDGARRRARPVGRAHVGAGRRRRRARGRVGRPGSTPPRSWRSCSAVRSASPAW